MRLFVGIDLPWSVREALSALGPGIGNDGARGRGGLAGARWAAPDTLHLTLRFIGPVRNDVADEIDAALAAVRGRRFDLALRGVGVFERGSGSKRSMSLWAGVAHTPELDHVQARIETALQRIGLVAEKRRFRPHVTLARVDQVGIDALAGWVQAHNLLRTEPVGIDGFTLFSSQPGPDQPVYTKEVVYALS